MHIAVLFPFFIFMLYSTKAFTTLGILHS